MNFNSNWSWFHENEIASDGNQITVVDESKEEEQDKDGFFLIIIKILKGNWNKKAKANRVQNDFKKADKNNNLFLFKSITATKKARPKVKTHETDLMIIVISIQFNRI